MDLSYVNEMFNFYEPDVSLHWLHEALEHLNCSTEVLVDATIATVACGFLVGFYMYRRSRRAASKSPFSDDDQTIRNVDLQKHYDIGRLRGVELFPENAQSSLPDDTGLLTDDLSVSSSSSEAHSEDIADPLLFNISMPEKDVSDSKENCDATPAVGDASSKMIYKKMIQDGLNSRLKLLHAEKNIYAQMRKMQRLKRSLLERSVENPAKDGSLNKTSIAISRRKTFFDIDDFGKTFLKRSTTTELNNETKENPTKQKLMNLKESINQLIDVHMNELSSLHVSIAEKRVNTRKLEKIKKEIDTLCENMKNDSNKEDNELTNDQEPTDKIVDDNLAVQDDDKKSSYDKNLMNQLQSISSLKDLFKNYDNEQELSTIMEKSNEDSENSLILLNDISTLQHDLKAVKKSWSRSSTPRNSPKQQPVSA